MRPKPKSLPFMRRATSARIFDDATIFIALVIFLMLPTAFMRIFSAFSLTAKLACGVALVSSALELLKAFNIYMICL